MTRGLRSYLCFSLVVLATGCYRVLPDRSGGAIKPPTSRPVSASDIAVPAGYTIELVATGLTFPTAVAWDDAQRLHVVESGYSSGEAFRQPRLLRIEQDGQMTTVATGENNGPWTGVAFHGGAFYIAEGGVTNGGGLLRIDKGGALTRVLSGLPTGGDHHANGPVVGPDGKLYLGLGTMTNSAVVGDDNVRFGWVQRHPEWHDVPCRDVKLVGENFESTDPRTGDKLVTGAFLPFGTPSSAGQVIRGQVPCSGSVLRVDPAGGEPELVAWGLRNPYGLAFTLDGKLLVTDNGYDDRGSRPVWGTADWLWTVELDGQPRWFGWPDYADGRSVAQARYKGRNTRQPTALLAEPPNEPPRPTAFFACHASADGIDVSRSERFGSRGWAFVAEFGDMGPSTAKMVAPAGFKVVRVDPTNGIIEDFAVNRGKENGPASRLKTGGLERPISVRFSPDGDALYVVDFGVLTMTKKTATPQDATGTVWRITRVGQGG